MYNDNLVDNEAIKAAVDERLKALGLKGDEPAKPVTKIPFTLAGQNYEFSSMEELQNAINGTFSSVATNQAELMRQLEDLKNAPNTGPSDDKTPKFDNAKFADLVQKDPIAAFNYVDEIRYGADRVPEAVKQQGAQLTHLQQQLTAYQFLNAHQEFQNTDDNARMLYGIMNNLGLGMDLQGFESAYRVGLANGLFRNSKLRKNRLSVSA